MTRKRAPARIGSPDTTGLRSGIATLVALALWAGVAQSSAHADQDVEPEVRTQASIIAELEARLRASEEEARDREDEIAALRAGYDRMLDQQRAVIATFLEIEPLESQEEAQPDADATQQPALVPNQLQVVERKAPAVAPEERPRTLAVLSEDAWATLQSDDEVAEILGWVVELENRLQRTEAERLALEKSDSEAARNEARLRWRVELLESQLAQVRANIAEASEPVRSFVDEEMSRITEALRGTGLDTRVLIARFAAEQNPQGGPFVPFEADVAAVPEFAYLAPAGVDLSFKNEIELFHQTTKLLHHLPLAAPLKTYRPSSGFGPRRDPINGRRAFHAGTDYLADPGAPILATGPGVVIHATRKGAFGRLVEIDHGAGIVSRYAHLSEINVEEGQSVERGERIGVIGRSGRTTGTHLHYEIRVDGEPLNPARLVNAGRSLAHVLGN